MAFFDNVLLGEHHELKNRRLHIYWNERHQNFSGAETSEIKKELSTSQDRQRQELDYDAPIYGTVYGTVKENSSATEAAILELIRSSPELSYDGLANTLGKSRRTVSRSIKILKDKGVLIRVGSDKTGHWFVQED